MMGHIITHLSATEWLLLGITALIAIIFITVRIGEKIGECFDAAEARLEYSRADMSLINKQTNAIQRQVPSPRRRTTVTSIATPVHQVVAMQDKGEAIKAHAVRLALLDFASGKRSANRYAAGTFAHHVWHTNYERVMKDQHRADVEVQTAAHTA